MKMNIEKDIIILPCTAKKIDIPFFFGKNFCAKTDGKNIVRPFDKNENGKTWYEVVEENQNSTSDALSEAYKLYLPKGDKFLYREVYEIFGDRLLILSSGWGLVKATYRLPLYEITFNETKADINHRNYIDTNYNDINHLPETLKKYPESKICPVLLGKYKKFLNKFLNGMDVDLQYSNAAAELGGANYTKVYRYVRNYILK